MNADLRFAFRQHNPSAFYVSLATHAWLPVCPVCCSLYSLPSDHSHMRADHMLQVRR